MRKIKKSFFTLVEVMVSMGVFALLMLALMQFFSAAQGVWERTGRKAETFDSARIAMDILADDLVCAYYELDHSSDYRFFDISSSDTGKTAVVFATQKPDGNAQIYYKWVCDSEYGKLYRVVEKEDDVTFSSPDTPSKAWFTVRGNTAWITNIKTTFSNESNKDKYLLAENVLDFEITAYKIPDLANPINIPDTSNTPPRTFPDVVRVSMTLLSPDAIEKLENRYAGESNIPAKIRDLYGTTFTYIKSDGSESTDKKNIGQLIKDNTPPAGGDDTNQGILFNGCQRFTRVVPLDRGQND